MNKMRSPQDRLLLFHEFVVATAILSVVLLHQALGTTSDQLQDPNVIVTEPDRRARDEGNLLIAADQSHIGVLESTASGGLLCRSAELLDEYCALSGPSGPVCASDGHRYESACALARATCQTTTTTTTPDGHLCRLSDESRCQAQQLCSRSAYQLFKLALWREFNSSAVLLFTQLDQNRNGLLEARELWPAKLSARDYARLVGKQDENSEEDDNQVASSISSCDMKNNREQLTTSVEFAFERHFHWSPCSLSHLLVHEGRSHDSSSSSAASRWHLTRSQFVSLFEEFERARNDAEHNRERPTRTTTSEVIMQMGETKLIDCLHEQPSGQSFEELEEIERQNCAWTRHGVNLASIENSESHVSIVTTSGNNLRAGPRLRLSDAQLYLSGVYRCSCHRGHSRTQSHHTIHEVRVQVTAQPHVSVRPKFQWSLPGSRVAFECHHDHIDTSPGRDGSNRLADDQFEWLRNKLPILGTNSTSTSTLGDRNRHHRLVLENVQLEDSGLYTCQVNASAARVRGEDSGRLLIQDQPALSFQDGQRGEAAEAIGGSLLWSFHENGVSVFRLQLPEDGQELELVQELSGQSRVSEQVDGNWNQLTLCGGLGPEQLVICEWSDNAILVEVAPPPPPPPPPPPLQTVTSGPIEQSIRKYIYIGQPNLNRVLVFDGRAGELVAVVATEPQPRRLFAFKPNKIHLSKWVRRRLGPLASLRWLQALEYQQREVAAAAAASANYHLQSQAHPLKLTPKSSRLYSDRVAANHEMADNDDDDDDRGGAARDQTEDNVRRFRRHLAAGQLLRATERGEQTNDREFVAAAAHSQQQQQQRQRSLPRLVQYDIWLLCYGKPLLVDAQSDLSDLPPSTAPLELEFEVDADAEERNLIVQDQAGDYQQRRRINRLRAAARKADQRARRGVKDDRAREQKTLHNQTTTSDEGLFTPWPHWSSLSPLLARTRSKEARLRNRKSVQIIQSTFLPIPSRLRSPHHHYNQQQQQQQQQQQGQQQRQINASRALGSQALNEFKRLTVLTTHHVIAGPPPRSGSLTAHNELERAATFTPTRRAPIDLVQDLCVPNRPRSSQIGNGQFKLHHAYVTHYAERQLYRVAMDTYRYDRQIDLHQCDPLALVPAVQGLLIVQCRAPITHQLNGQLVLDELTSARVQFNAQIKAQQAHLTPDSRYLVSIFANESRRHIQDNNQQQQQQQQQPSSVIYVQSVRVAGLKFLYEIKTSLEVAQCSFVWRDGYYAAIFVALNRRDQQTELLSLRLADGRLELIVRVPGLAWSASSSSTRHREPLNVHNQELQVAALSTSEGLYLVDLEENRVIQSVHDHHHRSRQSTSSLPTLVWV